MYTYREASNYMSTGDLHSKNVPKSNIRKYLGMTTLQNKQSRNLG